MQMHNARLKIIARLAIGSGREMKLAHLVDSWVGDFRIIVAIINEGYFGLLAPK